MKQLEDQNDRLLEFERDVQTQREKIETEQTAAKQKKKMKKATTPGPRQEAILIEQHRQNWERVETNFEREYGEKPPARWNRATNPYTNPIITYELNQFKNAK
jgi:hypothetical protein